VMTPRILVTGAAGMIGFSVAHALAASGRAVLGTDVESPPEPATFPFERADLRDFARLQAIAGSNVDAIIHCGAISGPMLGKDRPKDLVDINVGGTINVLEIARLTRARRFVYCSTCMAYGHTPDGLSRVSESAPLRANDTYGASKAAAEYMVNAFIRANSVDAVSLRLCWVYGPRRRTDCLVNRLIVDARGGKTTTLPFGGGFHRQFVYVDDVVDALRLALDAKVLPKRVYNVTGGQRFTFDEIAGVAGQTVLGVRTAFAPGADPDDYLQQRFNIDAIGADLGWRPKHDLASGVAAYARWLEGHAF
jgi:UDP-glucuronate 4-epimerase